MKPKVGDMIISKNSIEFYAEVIDIKQDRLNTEVEIEVRGYEPFPRFLIGINLFKERLGNYWILPNWTIPFRPC